MSTFRTQIEQERQGRSLRTWGDWLWCMRIIAGQVMARLRQHRGRWRR